jgi:PAS domain S-box-containing protein
VELMPVGVSVTDLEGTILYVNPAEAAMHGFENPVDLVGRQIAGLAASGEGHAMTWREISEMKTWRRESLNRRQDGSVFPVELVSDLVTDAEGQPVMIVTACVDLAKRSRVEEELRAEVARLQAALAAEVETTQKLRQGANGPEGDDEVTVKVRPEELLRLEEKRASTEPALAR